MVPAHLHTETKLKQNSKTNSALSRRNCFVSAVAQHVK